MPVARDVILPVDPETAYELVYDDDWVAGEPRVFEEAEPGERLVWWWDAGRVEVELAPCVGGTRVSIVETSTGPLCLA
jgi:hypothetical protein